MELRQVLKRGVNTSAMVYKRAGVGKLARRAGIEDQILRGYGRLQRALTDDEHRIVVDDIEITVGVGTGEVARHVDITDEKQFAKEFLDSIREDDTVFDIGAHIGIYSCLAATKADMVLAVEPHPKNTSEIKWNLRRNGLDGIVKELALSDESGQIHFDLGTDESGGVGRLSSATEPENRTCNVPVVRGDELVNEVKMKPDVLKIDIEGAEALALRGMSSVLEHVRVGFVEVHPNLMADYGTQPEEVYCTLEASGFKVRDIEEKSNGRRILIFSK